MKERYATQNLVKYVHRQILKRVLREYKSKRVVVLPHNIPDWDGATSAAVFARAFGWTFSLQPPMESSVFNGLKKLGFEFTPFSTLDPREFDGLVLLDNRSPNMFPPSISEWNIILLIDHHRTSEEIPVKHKIIIPEAEATARIIAELLNGKLVEKEMAIALAAGIYSDTLKLGVLRNPDIFPVFAELLRIGDIGNIGLSRLIDPLPTEEELRLTLQARETTEVIRHRGIRIATALSDRIVQRRIVEELWEHHHISIVGSNNGEGQRVSIRINDEVPVDGAAIMVKTGQLYGGNGGGHPKAAGCGGTGSLQEMINTVVRLVKEELDKSN